MKHLEPKKIVLIGASTGGPGQIQKIIDQIPKLHNTSIIIAQHMVDGFLESFTARLQHNHLNSINLIQDRETFENSNIYISEGNIELRTINNELLFTKEKAPTNSFNPNINLIFNSFVPLCNNRDILCVILTGIGNDGVEACSNLSKNGARCITESKESAIVDGMPNRARAIVPNIEINNLDGIATIINEFCE